MDALRLHGGPTTISRGLPRWPALAPGDSTTIMQCLTDRPWALGQRDCPPGGHLKRELEAEFARLVGVKHTLAVSSGTTALDLAFEALRIPADKVVVASTYGHPSTIRLAARTHRLLLLDVDPETLCLSADQLRLAIQRSDVGCVLTTHFAGQPGGADELAALCRAADVPLIEDASHAHGGRLAGRMAGSFGTLGCFSLHATKNLPAAEGGIITTDDPRLHEELWRAHDLGRNFGAGPYEFHSLGGNYRMSEIHAAIALAELPYLVDKAARRMREVDRLRAALAEGDGPLTILPRRPGVEIHAHHLVPARYDPGRLGGVSRNRLVMALAAEGVPCSHGWPSTLAALPPLRPSCIPWPTPVADAAIRSSVWLDARLFDNAELPGQVLSAIRKIVAHAPRLRGTR